MRGELNEGVYSYSRRLEKMSIGVKEKAEWESKKKRRKEKNKRKR